MLDIQAFYSPVLPSSSVAPCPGREDGSALDHSVQELFVECEYVMLTEFIECVVSLFYVAYMIALFHVPNARFYPEMQRLDPVHLARMVRNNTLYAMLECASLLHMHVFLRISARHLLANILERDLIMLQSVFITWVIIVLQFTVEHSGECHWICY